MLPYPTYGEGLAREKAGDGVSNRPYGERTGRETEDHVDPNRTRAEEDRHGAKEIPRRIGGRMRRETERKNPRGVEDRALHPAR